VGDLDAANENWKFHVGKNLVRLGGGDLIWFGPLKRFQKLFFHTPLVNGFILASDVYHDFYRWPWSIAASSNAGVKRPSGGSCSSGMQTPARKGRCRACLHALRRR